MRTGSIVLDVRDLRVRFAARAEAVDVVRGVSFALHEGDTLAVVGESGSGKSVTLRSLMRLLPSRRARITGRVQFDGRDLLLLPESELRRIRGRDIAMIFQEPALAFDPVFTIGHQLIETIRYHTDLDRVAAQARALEHRSDQSAAC